jgi:hypothetical protein
MRSDFVEMLSALSAEGADFLLVGAHAMGVHGYARATADLDVWVRPTPENARRVMRALARFGAPLDDLTEEDLASPDVVFQIGIPPLRIDVLTSISGVTFDDAWPRRWVRPWAGVDVPVIAREDLLKNKRSTGRRKDQIDAAWLEDAL